MADPYLAIKARYRERHREELRERNREYYRRKPEMKSRYRRVNREARRLKHRVWEHNRRARARGAGGSFTTEQWLAVCDHFGNKCPGCGRYAKLTQDHIIPLSLGGTNDISNIQPLCQSCNCKKNNRVLICYLPWPLEGIRMHENKHKSCDGHGDARSY